MQPVKLGTARDNYKYNESRLVVAYTTRAGGGGGGGGNPSFPNYGGYKKTVIGGLILGGFKGAKLTKISCVRF